MPRSLPVLLTFVLLGFGGCAVKEPLLSVTDDAKGCPLTVSQMETSITEAAREKGWSVKSVATGSLQARYKERFRMAKVAITHTADHYQIDYLDSFALWYDGSRIDRHYNRWVGDLHGAITRSLDTTCVDVQRRIEEALAARGEEVDLPVMEEAVPSELQIIR